MLLSITHWLQIGGTAVDAVLLLRVLQLRLQHTYTFITLACTLTLLFDLADIYFGSETAVGVRIFVYSRFLYVILFPLVAWDVFEEMKTRIAKVRRLAVTRLISGLFFTMVLSVLLVAFIDTDDLNAETSVVNTLAIILWAGASTASLAFLVTIHRVLRSQPMELPNNTIVWMRFYELVLAAEVLSCFLILITQYVRSRITGDIIDIALNLYGIAITAWCIFKLRRIPSEDVSQAEKAAF